jgi:CRP/FNR family transcriptional regulator, cyclic AMP receptor protein
LANNLHFMIFFGKDASAPKVEMLKSIPIFSKLTSKEVLELDELLHERVYEKDEIVFEEGDLGHGIYILVSGKLRVNPSHKRFKTLLLEIGPGELLGELTLFEEAPRTATVVATERTVMVALFQAEFTSLLAKNKSIGVKVLTEIARVLIRRSRQLVLHEQRLPSL